MTVRQATAEMFRRYTDMLGEPGAGHTDARLRWMCATALQHAEDWPVDKLPRWLGFVQGVLVERGVLSIDTERDFSRPLFRAAYGTGAPDSVGFEEENKRMTEEAEDMSPSIPVDIVWPESISVGQARKLGRKIRDAAGIAYCRALHIVAAQYGFPSWDAALAALEDSSECAARYERKMHRQQRRAKKWAAGNEARRVASDALADSEPGWVGRGTATAAIEGCGSPVDRTAVSVVFRPRCGS